jgi:hypothetical protein
MANRRSNDRNCQPLVLLIGDTSAADDEDVPDVGLQLDSQRKGAGQVQVGDHSSRVREAGSWRRKGEEHDRRVEEQLVPTLVDELDCGGLDRNHEVDPLPLVLHAQEITEGLLITCVGEPPLVDVFRKIDQIMFETLVEYSRQLKVTRSGHRGISTGRVQDEHLFRVGCSPCGLDRTEDPNRHGDQATPEPEMSE